MNYPPAPAGVDLERWEDLMLKVEEYRETLAQHRTDPGSNAEPGMVAEEVANICVDLLLPSRRSSWTRPY